MDILKDADIDPAPLAGKRVAIIGYGNQGRAQALNLHDSGIDVVVGLRGGSGSMIEAEAAGLRTALAEEAAGSAGVVMMLAPDGRHAALYRKIEPHLREGTALGFSHGLSVRFGLVEPRSDLDVFLVAPKGPGTALRSLYEQGKGMIAVWAMAQDATGKAGELALAYGRAIGCARAGLIASSFAEEAEADLFNEQAVVWGESPVDRRRLRHAGRRGGIAGVGLPRMRRRAEASGRTDRSARYRRHARSDLEHRRTRRSARRQAHRRCQRARAHGRTLQDVRAGRFAEELRREEASGYSRLQQSRVAASGGVIEQVFKTLRAKP